MGQQAVFFDRDNTLIVSDGYLGEPDRVRLMPGAADAVARARALGYAVVVVSNQSGVARGMFPEAAVRAVNQRVEQMLKAENPAAIVDRQEYCPFHPQASVPMYRQESELRKPAPGMLLKARRELGLEEGGWCVGDAPRDVSAGRAAGCRTILFRPVGVVASPAADEPADVKPDFEVTSLREALDIIERDSAPGEPPVVASAAPEKGATENVATPGPAVGVLPDARVVSLLEQLVVESRRRNEAKPADFSIATLMAGLVQVLALATVILSYLLNGHTQELLLLAVFLQMLVTSLVLMGQQK